MAEEILIVKKKRSQEVFTAKIRKKVKKGWSEDRFMKTFNPADYRDVALLLLDLEVFGVPIEEAINTFRINKSKSTPWF